LKALRISVAFMSCAQAVNALRMISVVTGSALVVALSLTVLTQLLPRWPCV
jgi:hypothetical protein